MTESKQSLPIAIVWTEVIISAVVSWIIKKILDNIWNRTKLRIKVVSSNRTFYGWFLADQILVDFFFSYPSKLRSLNDSGNDQETTRQVLGCHERLHQHGFLNAESCQYCRIILQSMKTKEPQISVSNMQSPSVI
jgi:hypothetical protein